jgi:DNA-binding CsgD family transcriptional regulator
MRQNSKPSLLGLEGAMLAAAIDAIGAGVFLVSGDGVFLHANASGRAMLRRGEVLRRVRGMTVPADLDARQALLNALTATADGSTRSQRGISVPLRSRDGTRYVAHVLPLTFKKRGQTPNRRVPVAAMFVRKAVIPHSAIDIIGQHYRLTPTELRVVFVMMEVAGVRQVARTLGISDDTVKTHLRRVFAKTRINRQADLIKLVAGFVSPLAE